MKYFRTRWAVLLISVIFLSSCGGSNSSEPATPQTPEGISGGVISPQALAEPNTIDPPTNVYPGHVGNTTTGSKSYYTANVTIGRTYTITMFGLSADADLLVYNDRPFDYSLQPNQFSGGCASRNGGTTNEQCVVTANSSTMNIEIDGQYALSGATYSISLIQIDIPIPAALCGGSGICFDFDANPALFPGPFVLTETGGVTPLAWDLDTGTALEFGYSIYSGGLINSETSCFSYTTTTSTDSYVSFDLKVTTTQQYYDQLLFYIDNVLQLPVWSGTVIPQKVMFNTTSATHTYKWCHSYTGSSMSGDVWVDNIYIQ